MQLIKLLIFYLISFKIKDFKLKLFKSLICYYLLLMITSFLSLKFSDFSYFGIFSYFNHKLDIFISKFFSKI